MNNRQQRIREGLAIIGVERLANFIKAQATQANDVIAIKTLKKQLDKGGDLEEVLLHEEPGFYGFILTVTPIGANRFRINLGCQALPTAGDGGSWDVTFDDAENIIEKSGGRTWVS